MRRQGLFVVGLPVIFSFQALATPLVPGPTCPLASLASYISMQGGCTLGEIGFINFSFTGSGTNPISASAVTVTPVFFSGNSDSLPTAGLSFSSPGFSVTGSQSATYFLNYSIDPHPIIVNFDDTLDTSSPVAPGVTSITTDLCIGGSFIVPSSLSPFAQQALEPIGCTQSAGSPPAFGASLNVFDNGVTKKLFDTTGTFDPANFTDVQNVIQLSANGAKADFNKFTNSLSYIPDTQVPEPASYALISGGLLVLWLRGRRRASN